MSISPYQSPAAKLEAPDEPRLNHSGRFAAWATVLMFACISIALAFPLDEIGRLISAQKVPPLPPLILDNLPLRHFWHLLTATALAMAIVLQRRRTASTALRRWSRTLLVLLWVGAYLASYLIDFYINLYSISLFHLEVRVRPIFTGYIVLIGAALSISAAWRKRRGIA